MYMIVIFIAVNIIEYTSEWFTFTGTICNIVILEDLRG